MSLCGKSTIPCLLPQGRGQTFPTSGRFSLQRYIFFTKQRTCGCSFVNVFVKPNEQNRACSSYAMARKRRMKSNVFVKPNEQNRACSSYAMARKRRMKSNVLRWEGAFLCYLLHNKLYHNAPKSIKLNKIKSRKQNVNAERQKSQAFSSF